jgi:glycosyltransferase involved in cell wall biosynthesis
MRQRIKIALISQYPPAEETHSRQSGIASYSKNLAKAIRANGNEVVVLGDREGSSTSHESENGIEVLRCWRMGWKSWFQIARHLLSLKTFDVIHVQYTVALYGGTLSTIVCPFFLLLIKILRRPVVVTIHEVVPQSSIDKNFLAETGFKGNVRLLRLCMYLLIKSIYWTSNCLVVHSNYFREVLVKEYGCKREKVSVTPHGIEQIKEIPERGIARKALGLNGKKIVLFFGYLARYKGVHRLVEAFRGMNSDYMLIVAGGEHPRLKRSNSYKIYLDFLRRQAYDAKAEIIFTGFVKESDIPLLFSAADVLILPYARLISASGPMSLCISYGKPFLASKALSGLIDSPELLFENDTIAIRKKIEEFFADNTLKDIAIKRCGTLFGDHLWPNVAKKTDNLYRSLLKSTV